MQRKPNKEILAVFCLFIFCWAQAGEDDRGGIPSRPAQPPKRPAFPVLANPDPNLSFSSGTDLITLAHGKAVVWKGCDINAVVSAGLSSDSRCGHEYLHPNYVKHLNNHFLRCATRSAAKANWPAPVRVFINHMGTYADRNVVTKALSLHAYARAIDIGRMTLYDGQGRATHFHTLINYYSGANAVFYDEFRQCWKESMPSKCGKWAETSIGHVKSKMGGNGVHYNHIHLAFPFCADQ